MYSLNIATSPPPKQKKKILISNQYCKPFHWTCSETLEHKSCYRAHFSERDGNILIGTSWKALPHWKPVRRAHPPPRQLQPHQNPLMNLASDISLVFTLVRPQSRNNLKPYFQVSCPDCSAGGPGNTRPLSLHWSRYLEKPSVFYPPLQISKQFLLSAILRIQVIFVEEKRGGFSKPRLRDSDRLRGRSPKNVPIMKHDENLRLRDGNSVTLVGLDVDALLNSAWRRSALGEEAGASHLCCLCAGRLLHTQTEQGQRAGGGVGEVGGKGGVGRQETDA